MDVKKTDNSEGKDVSKPWGRFGTGIFSLGSKMTIILFKTSFLM